MRIAFFGASDLGFDCCKSLIEQSYEIVGVYTIPEKFSIKYKNEEESSLVSNSLYKDFSSFESFGIPVTEIKNSKDIDESKIRKQNPDLIIVIGWYFNLPNSIINYPKLGTIGIHASLLPKYRGNAPLVWAMINGEKESGVTLFYFEKGIDKGDIIKQKSFSIGDDENISDILNKAKLASIEVLNESIPQIKEGTSNRIVQDESQASYYPRRTPDDGLIDWNMEPLMIKNFIRAQTKPYPGAFTIINNKKVIIWDADIIKI